MKYFQGDIIKEKLGEKCAICITTNGFTKKNGEAVMGKGIAKQICEYIPSIPKILGKKIKENGNICQILGKHKNTVLISFPVKPITMDIDIEEDFDKIVKYMKKEFKMDDIVPGWACKADLFTIKISCIDLRRIAEKLPTIPIYLPKPGCGAGELKWSEVKPIIKKYYVDNIIISDFKK